MVITDGSIDNCWKVCYNVKIGNFAKPIIFLREELKMIDHYLSSEANGAKGALNKAWMLNRECRYNIIAITHTLVPQAGSLATPFAKNYRKLELGYRITVDTLPTMFSDFIPSIIEA